LLVVKSTVLLICRCFPSLALVVIAEIILCLASGKITLGIIG